MDEQLLQKYADFIIRVGVNVRPRQTLIVRCPVTAPWFGHACARAGYAAGAKNVLVRYEDEQLARIRYELGSEEALCEVKPSELRSWLDYAEDPDGCCLLAIHASDPQIFQSIDPGKLSRVTHARSVAMKEWQEYTMNDRLQWCVVSIPTPGWAARVFPDLPVDAAQEKLWQLIFDACRVTADNDPVAEWRAHVAQTTACRDKLNALALESVHFTSANGTDLTVELAEGARWEGAQSTAENGAVFIANIPTEEVFTAPHRERVNGVVKGTRPYVYNGALISGFSVTFRDGKVVEHSAEQGDELLEELLHSDENACRIGEVALVPAGSPINRSGVLFYNTLFDENAACHIAFGAGYPTTICGGAEKTREQLLALGLNDSAIHEDVMIGAEDTRVTGRTRDGRTVTIFENGEWAL